MSKDDLQDSSWSSPPLVLHWDIHSQLITNCDCKDTTPPPSQPETNERARLGHSSQDGDAQQRETGPLLIPQLTRLHEAYHVRGEDTSNMPTIPSEHRVTIQILKHWHTFKVLQQTFSVSRRAEQLYRLRTQQSIVAADEDSVLRTETRDLQSQLGRGCSKAYPLV